MHYRCVVLVPKSRINGAQTEKNIKATACEIFEEVMNCGWDYDWYVVGGRWSGTIKGKDVALLDEELYNEELKEYEGLENRKLGRVWYSPDIPVEKRQYCEPLFETHLVKPNYDKISKRMIGRYYLVIIDYHF